MNAWTAPPGELAIDEPHDELQGEPEPTYEEQGEALERFGRIVARDHDEISVLRDRVRDLEAALRRIQATRSMTAVQQIAKDVLDGVEF